MLGLGSSRLRAWDRDPPPRAQAPLSVLSRGAAAFAFGAFGAFRARAFALGAAAASTAEAHADARRRTQTRSLLLSRSSVKGSFPSLRSRTDISSAARINTDDTEAPSAGPEADGRGARLASKSSLSCSEPLKHG